ncbi:MAG: hypothetical protein CFE24_00570 [Flavobacterium sp. BFFFF2]|nr:MAG: hypothetical protein CFE24_00570 [Flavobacterium sp. BFFFF2]
MMRCFKDVFKIIKGSCLLLTMGTTALYAQQEAQFSHYMFNTQAVNPAYVGSRGTWSAFTSYRKQWQQFSGAPETAVLAFQVPVPEKSMGLGGVFMQDQLGPTRFTQVNLQYAYIIRWGQHQKLAFGLQAGWQQFQFDRAKVSPETTADPTLENLVPSARFGSGLGVYWHNQKGYAGFSIPSVIEQQWAPSSDWVLYQQARTYYFITGWTVPINDKWMLKPALLLKTQSNWNVSTDLAMQVWWQDRFTAGLNIRLNTAYSVMGGFKIWDSWLVGYAYDRETTSLKSYNTGSHEIFLRYEWKPQNKGVVSPRYF